MAQGQVLLKKIFFQGLSFLNSEITLPFANLCFAFQEKLFFSATIVL